MIESDECFATHKAMTGNQQYSIYDEVNESNIYFCLYFKKDILYFAPMFSPISFFNRSINGESAVKLLVYETIRETCTVVGQTNTLPAIGILQQ